MAEVTGSIATARAGRYAKQLASHWNAKATVTELTDGGVRIEMDPTTWTVLTPTADRLAVVASSADFGDVVKRHLERFGHHDELNLSWDS